MNRFAFAVSTIFQLTLGLLLLTVTLAFKFLKNPLKTKGIPFIAYNLIISPLILHLILDVGTSDGNSTGSGTIDVCNLGCPAGPGITFPSESVCIAVLLDALPFALVAVDCVPKTNLPSVTIPTLAPKEILANFCVSKF